MCRTENGVDAGPGNLNFQTVADVVDAGQSGTLWRVGFLPGTPKTTATDHARQGRAKAVFAFDLHESLCPSDQTQHQPEPARNPGKVKPPASLCGSGFYSVIARGPLSARSCIKPSETLRPGCSSQAPQECKKISLRLSETFLWFHHLVGQIRQLLLPLLLFHTVLCLCG